MPAFSLLAFFVVADARALSIDDVLALAEDRSGAVDIAEAGVRRAEADTLGAWSEWYPQAGASLTYTRTLQSEFDGLFPGTPSTDGLASAFEELPFGRKNIWRPGVFLSQNLFAGGRSIARLSQARAGRDLAKIAVEITGAQAMLEAVQAYYDVVLADRLLKIAEASLRQAELTLDQTRLGVENGTMPAFDQLRAQVTLENQRPSFLQRRDDLEAAQLRLQQVLDLPLNDTLALTTSLEGDLADITPAVRAASGLSEVNDTPRAPVRQARGAVTVSEAGVHAAWSQHLPQLDVNLDYSPVAYPNDLFPGYDELRPNSAFNVSLQLPIFSGFRVTADIERANADVDEAYARLRETEELARLDSRATKNQLATATATYAATAGVLEQARRAVSIAQLRYAEGISTQLELRDAQLQLDQAEANRAVAARDLQVTRTRVVLLPLLPAAAGFVATPTAASASTATGSGPQRNPANTTRQISPAAPRQTMGAPASMGGATLGTPAGPQGTATVPR